MEGGALPAGGLVAAGAGDAGPRLVATRLPAADEAVLGQGGAPSPDVSVMSLAGAAPDRPPEDTGPPPAFGAGELVPAPGVFRERNGCVEVGTCGGTGVGDGPSGPIGAGMAGSCGSSALGGGLGVVTSGLTGPTGFSGIIGPSGEMGNCR